MGYGTHCCCAAYFTLDLVSQRKTVRPLLRFHRFRAPLVLDKAHIVCSVWLPFFTNRRPRNACTIPLVFHPHN